MMGILHSGPARPSPCDANAGAAREPVRPDYAGGSIVNLVESVARALGADPPAGHVAYPPLACLPVGAIDPGRPVVLLVVDGLGLRHLLRAGAGASLRERLVGQATSVFPSTTASAITSLLTGVAPQQHAVTGWHMWVDAIEGLAAPLPFWRRGDERALDADGLAPAALFHAAPLFARLRDVPGHVVQPAHLTDTPYTVAHAGPAARHGVSGLAGLVDTVSGLVRRARPCLVYAYWAALDTLAHLHGIGSEQVQRHLAAIDAAFARLADEVAGRATLIVTADHGFVDTTPDSRLDLLDHPELAATLRAPLAGEPRAVYCYLRPGAERGFRDYVEDALGHACTAHAGGALIAAGWFGTGAPHPRLPARVGDRVLVMKERFILFDRVTGEAPGFSLVGVHGGPSPDEMLVPVVVAGSAGS